VKIALIGYGKMGKEIEKLTLNTEDEIALKIDLDNQHEFTPEKISGCDVAIEFTSPSTVVNNIKKCFKAGIPIVAGTTGWNDQLEEITSLCKEYNQTLFYSSNYSLGVNLFFAANKYLASLMNKFPEYKVSMEEIHHTMKLDAPSGTAITAAEDISRNLDRVKGWTMDKNNNQGKIIIKATREGDVKGIHEVTYDSEIDFLSIKHSAKNRVGFAKGALMAAKYIKDRKGVYTMNDLLGF
jgi:4-hydroxy-tetrahydrodipicolinate reductase